MVMSIKGEAVQGKVMEPMRPQAGPATTAIPVFDAPGKL
jgi:hypothetical protein